MKGVVLMELTYTKKGDYFYPNLEVPKGKFDDVEIGRYGREKLEYLKENKKANYMCMVMKNTLHDYLVEVDMSAKNMKKSIINDMKKFNNVTEEMKHKDQLGWVGMMNNIKNTAQEIVRNELIYN